jgi:Domain of unknown function (DUF4398)
MSMIFDAKRNTTRWKALPAWVVTSFVILCAFENSGCTTAKPPTEALSKAELDVRAASEARADEFAPMNLQSARDKLEQSKQAMAAKSYEEARRLAEVAQVKAELAGSKAEAEITRRAAAELLRRIDALGAATDRSAIQKSSAGFRQGEDHEGK